MPVSMGMFEGAVSVDCGSRPRETLLGTGGRRGAGDGGGGPGLGRAGVADVVQSTATLVNMNDFVNPDQWPTRATLASLLTMPKRVEWIEVVRRAEEFRCVCENCPEGGSVGGWVCDQIPS